MTRRPSITAAIIALNEEQKLPGLLARLDWVDEIVVVDGGSHDATFHIARRHGCHVVRRTLDSFARQRNFASQLASGDWVFSIDADERPTRRLIDEIRGRVARGPQQAFRVPIRSTIFGRPLRRSGTQDDCPVRLFRRQSARWAGDVHEVLKVAGRIGRLDSWLEHETLPDLPAFLAKIERYTTLEARARVAAGRRPAWYAPWLAPPREAFRRLFWKQGLLDGPAGWAFCLLSGLSEWVLAGKHRRLWRETRLEISRECVSAAIVGPRVSLERLG
jgi:glycosyltransferase involved in cell wall biosynthesis